MIAVLCQIILITKEITKLVDWSKSAYLSSWAISNQRLQMKHRKNIHAYL